jgi:hypothetical protein
MDGQSGNIYVINGETVKYYQPLISNVQTRSGIQCWFDTTAGVATHLLPEGMVPATIDHSRTAGSLASAVFSPNPLPGENSNLRQTMDSQQAKLYNALLQIEPIPYQEIGKSLLQGSLTISVSSSGWKESETYSGSWSFHNHSTIYSGLNTAICKAKYRVELYALWEAIHVLLTTERELLASCGKNKNFLTPEVTIAVSQKRIMHRIFTQTPIGVKDTVQPHYDLILEICHLLSLCESRTKAIHVPGQSITIHPKSKYPSSTNRPHPMVEHQEVTLATQIITVHHAREPIIEGLDRIVHHEHHRDLLQSKLQKDNGWSDEQFLQIEWQEYYRALRGISRSHRVSIAKLSHQLWNTNLQNHRYYGTSDTCSLCGISSETPDHIYSCTHPAAVESRTQAATIFCDTLSKKTPPSILSALITALTCQPSEFIEVAHEDIIIKQHELGRFSMCRGHIIKDWLSAYKSAAGTNNTLQGCADKKARGWLIQVIRALWRYSKTLWSNRNAARHGKHPQFTVSHTRKQLQEQALTAYHRYEVDPHSIPLSRRYLFHKPLESILLYSDDSLRCWIASVKEAELTAEQRLKTYSRLWCNTLHHYFGSTQAKHRKPQGSS